MRSTFVPRLSHLSTSPHSSQPHSLILPYMGSTTVVLHNEDRLVSDIDIRHQTKNPLRSSKLTFVSYVNYEKIPWFLISLGPFNVYSLNEDTNLFFQHYLYSASLSQPHTGILSKSNEPHVYVVFFVHKTGVRCICIDFTTLERLATASRSFETGKDDNIYYSSLPTGSDTTIFDRVLENKSSKRNQYIAPRARNPSTTPLSVALLSGDQVAQAVNRLTLSGLRLRGLNPSSGLASSKDRVAIRELYHMTRKLALFALRKYNYGFNGVSSKEVRLSDVQDVVERLLEAYVDVEQPT